MTLARVPILRGGRKLGTTQGESLQLCSPGRVENLDGDNVRPLSDAVAGACGNTGDVRTVTVVIGLRQTGASPAENRATTKVSL